MKRLLLVFVLLCMIPLVSCDQIPSGKDIYDNVEEIAKQGDSYTYQSRVGNIIGHHATITFKGFSGADTIIQLNQVKTYRVVCETTLQRGRFKVVLITPTLEVIELEDEMEIEIDESGYRIKLVGENATGTIDFNLIEIEAGGSES